MVVKGYITDTIDERDKLYNRATSQKKAMYYSKLALLELDGWLEEKMEIPDAFRAAQKEMREQGFDPYRWAGFVLVE